MRISSGVIGYSSVIGICILKTAVSPLSIGHDPTTRRSQTMACSFGNGYDTVTPKAVATTSAWPSVIISSEKNEENIYYNYFSYTYY